jgi:hypothetical protein
MMARPFARHVKPTAGVRAGEHAGDELVARVFSAEGKEQ